MDDTEKEAAREAHHHAEGTIHAKSSAGHGKASRFLYGVVAGAAALLLGTIVRAIAPVFGARLIGLPMNVVAPLALGLKSILLLAFRPFKSAKTNVAAMAGAAVGAAATLAILIALCAPGGSTLLTASWTSYLAAGPVGSEVPQAATERRKPARVFVEPAWDRAVALEGSRCTVRAESPSPDAGPLRARVERYVAAIDAALETYPRLLPQVPEPRGKLPVYVFARESDYREFADDEGDRTRGQYVGGRVFSYEAADERTMLEVLRHEALHGFMDGIKGGVPAWLNEGTARYVEEMGALEEAGRVPASLAAELSAALAEGWEGKPLDRFLRLSSKEFYDTARARHYLQAWTFVHFLRHFDGGRYRPLHDRYVAALVSTHRFDDAYAASFAQADLVAMHREWLAYVRSLR